MYPMVDVNFNVFVSFWNNLESIESQIRRTFLKFISTITNNFIMEIESYRDTNPDTQAVPS
jgi:tyrosyl-tRNA synthetase